MSASRSLFWWMPNRPVRALAGESLNNGAAWLRLYTSRDGRSLSNFGDAVSPLIMRELTSRIYRWAPLGSADFVAVGSVLNEYARVGSEAIIFGSGVRIGGEFSDNQKSLSRNQTRGVRGYRSAEVLGLPAECAIGDPALVVSELLSSGARAAARKGVSILPHFAAFGNRRSVQVLNRLRTLGYEVLQPNQDPIELAGRIRETGLLLTSSLHGIVFADSVGTSVLRVSFPGVHHENDFKYHDYESLYGRESVDTDIRMFVDTPPQSVSEKCRAVAEERGEFVANVVDNIKNGLYERGALLR